MKPYLKAVVAFLVAATGALATAAVDNSIVLGEWMAALATAVAAGGAVFATPNKSDVEVVMPKGPVTVHTGPEPPTVKRATRKPPPT